MSTDPLAGIPGLIRIETTPRTSATSPPAKLTECGLAHEELYGRFVTLESHLDCPPEEVFDYLADPYNLQEWTYGVRDLKPIGRSHAPGDGWDTVLEGWDRLSDDTRIYIRAHTDRQALTVDYHCAWDQSEDLWMVYLYRLVCAERVLGQPGTVLLWTNCRHRYYDENPYPETAPSPRRPWVGEYWDFFRVGHAVELRNLATILEYRHRQRSRQRPDDRFFADGTVGVNQP